MRTLIKTGVFHLLSGMVMIAAGFTFLRAQGVSEPSTAAGRAMSSEVRPVADDVVAITMNGPVDLILTQGLTPSLIVRGEHRLLSMVKTEQSGTTLTVGINGVLINPRRRLSVEVTLPSLQKLSINGGGDGTVNGFKGEKLDLAILGSGNVIFNGNFQRVGVKLVGSGDIKLDNGVSEAVDLDMLGSGDIVVTGQSKALNAKILGSGDLSAKRLIADAVAVSVAGSGDAVVTAKQAASLSITGSGDIKVAGNPTQRSVSRNGSGEVTWE